MTEHDTNICVDFLWEGPGRGYMGECSCGWESDESWEDWEPAYEETLRHRGEL